MLAYFFKVENYASLFLIFKAMKHKNQHVCFSMNWKISNRKSAFQPNAFWTFLFCFALSSSLIFQKEAKAESKPILSSKARISILTCGPGPELYEAFGHTAIRVQDPQQVMDLTFNYGVFDFEQENFYGNFAMGFMRYMLGVATTEDFLFSYRRAKRSVREQVLNLDSSEKQKIAYYLEVNLKPENREYFYDYFYNNCSTKIVELLDSALNRKVIWQWAEPEGNLSFRALIRQYATFQSWGRLGIDLGLGALIDKPIRGKDLDFLPDALERDLNRASLQRNLLQFPLVLETHILYEAPAAYGEGSFFLHPAFIFSLILLISCFLYVYSSKLGRIRKAWNLLWLLLVSLLGWVETLIWFFTNHKAAAWNYNILWANPIWLILVLANVGFRHKNFANLKAIQWYYSAILVFWFLLPQTMNENLLPLVFALWINALPSKKKIETREIPLVI